MLNKLRFYKYKLNAKTQSLLSNSQIAEILALRFNKSIKDIKVSTLGGGTLGTTYRIDGIKSTPTVLKTYFSGIDYKNILKNECHLLKVTNHNMFCEMLTLPDNESAMIMDYIEKTPGEITPNDILELIETYNSQIIGSFTYSMDDLIHTSLNETSTLENNNLITNTTAIMCKDSIKYLKENLSHIKKVLCHGDLSNKNIIRDCKGNLIIIDWEDVFMGPQDYDYLYWLSFFCNRKYYTKSVFEKCNSSKEIIRGIILVILVIKSALSFYNGSYLTNLITSETRINEILNVLK